MRAWISYIYKDIYDPSVEILSCVRARECSRPICCSYDEWRPGSRSCPELYLLIAPCSLEGIPEIFLKEAWSYPAIFTSPSSALLKKLSPC